MKFSLLVLALLLFSGTVMACSEDGQSGILPKNNLRIPVGVKTAGGVTLAQFNAAIKRVEVVYAPVIASLGGSLSMKKDWANDEVNAFASREGRSWQVHMTGGLARHPTMTVDAFTMVICHEVGHHIGGAPKKKIGNLWSSTEGQSDYWAALKCLRHVFLNDNNSQIVRSRRVPPALNLACSRSHGSSSPERDLCIRIALAGQDLGIFFQQVMEESKVPSFTTPDRSSVAQTFEKHPASQCRMDTFFQGAVCEKSMNESVSQTDEVKGTCHRTLGDRVGLRPSCWFKSK